MPTATLSAPPASQPSSTGPQIRKWTVREFNRLGDMGWFEGRRAFLLNGVILENGPMDPPHAMAIELLNDLLPATFGAGWRRRIQLPLHLDQYNDPEPDLAIIAGSPRDSADHPTTAALVVEIADTSLTMDVTEKAERYATAGVADYWVLDLNSRQLIVFRDPVSLPVGLGATAYRTKLVLNPTDRITPLAAPQASILVSDMLP